MQKQENGRFHPIQYVSRSLSREEKEYSTSKREAIEAIFCLKMFGHYLLLEPLIIYSYHQALRSASGKAEIHSRLSRCLNFMAEHNFGIPHLPGNRNVVADCLSLSTSADSKDANPEKLNIDQFLEKNSKERIDRDKMENGK